MWTYQNAPSTTTTGGRRDAVRLLVKDNSTLRGTLLQDEEIAFFLSLNGNNVLRGAAYACRALAAREAQAKRVGDLSIQGLGENYLKLAAQYESQADMQATPYAGGIGVFDHLSRELDTDRLAPVFSKAMIQNPNVNTPGSTISTTGFI